jgi:thioredoxin 1
MAFLAFNLPLLPKFLFTMSSQNVVELTDSNFEQLVMRSALPLLVDFWAPWCGPCRMIGPVLEEIAAEYKNRAIVGKVNVDENPGVASQFRIQAIPALFFFKGGKVVDKVVGMTAKSALTAKLDALL